MSLKAVSLSEQIAQHLAEQIITGTLAPGARLPENELAKQLDVSTNSLREAFRVLEKQHLIELQPRKGARVCDVSDEQVHDLYDFLFMLLSRFAGQAASNWMPGQIEDLVEMPVNLQLFVRVTSGWREKPALLRDFGLLGDGEQQSRLPAAALEEARAALAAVEAEMDDEGEEDDG